MSQRHFLTYQLTSFFKPRMPAQVALRLVGQTQTKESQVLTLKWSKVDPPIKLSNSWCSNNHILIREKLLERTHLQKMELTRHLIVTKCRTTPTFWIWRVSAFCNCSKTTVPLLKFLRAQLNSSKRQKICLIIVNNNNNSRLLWVRTRRFNNGWHKSHLQRTKK